MNINVQIDRLVLEGVPISSSQGRLLQGAVEAELGRLLRREGLPAYSQGSGAVSGDPGGTIQLTPERNFTQLGQQIARAVYRGMKQ